MSSWWDQGHGGLVLAWGLFAAALLLVAGAREGERRPARWWGAPVFLLTLFLCLLTFRWPILFVPHDLNVDESQMIAGAITLRHDPVFWRSVETQTAGPLDIYPLILPTILAGERPLVGARGLGLVLVWAVLGLSYWSARRFYPERIARAGAVALLAFFALTVNASLVHYSTEHVPIFLLSAGIACFLKFHGNQSRRWLFLAGVLLGAIPLAKLQGILLGGWVFVGGAAVIWRDERFRVNRAALLATFTAGAGSGVFCLAVHATAFGLWHEVYMSYVAANFSYVGRGEQTGVEIWWRVISKMAGTPSFAPLVGSAVLLSALALIAQRRTRSAPAWFHLFTLGGGVVGLVSVLWPGRVFEHYFLLLTPLLGLQIAAALGSLAAGGRTLKVAAWVVFFVATIGLPVAHRLAHGKITTEDFRDPARIQEGPADPLVQAVKQWTRPGDALALWGWETEIFVHTRCRQATRESNTSGLSDASEEIAHFRARYLSDFKESRARVFVDTTPAHRRGYGFEDFPEMVAYVEEHYELRGEFRKRRFYVWKEASAPGGTP